MTKEQENLLWENSVLDISTAGFVDLKIENKIIPIYCNAIAGDRCHVKQLDLYLSKLPEKALYLAFYFRPLPKIPEDACKPWHSATWQE